MRGRAPRPAWTWLVLTAGAILTMSSAAADLRLTRVVAQKESLIVSGTGAAGPVEVVEVAPYEGAAVARGRTGVSARVSRVGGFRVRVSRWEGPRDRLYSGWVVRSGDAMSPPRFVERLAGVSRHTAPFPRAASKKGLQVQMVDDAVALGVKHAALNVDLARMPDLQSRRDSLTWTMDGETFRLRRSAVEQLDRQVKLLSHAGALVYLILLAYDPRDPDVRRIMLHPAYDLSAPNRLGAFNTSTPDGLKWFKALMEFLVDRYSRPEQEHGRAVGFILGNEVNSHWWWSNMGPVSLERFTEEYLRTLRVAWTAARKQSAAARLYISLDHHWTILHGGNEQRAFRGKSFVDLLARRTAETGPFDWNVAYHPYPENLFECRTWLDRTAEPHPETPRITFKNLQVLTGYLKRPELRHNGRSRRVILSEQGFHTPDRLDGERDQAAAYCYAYYRSAHLPGIDAFILHRHVDHKGEGGLKLGLWTWKEASPSPSEPGRKKLIYDVFKAADTKGWREAFRFALPVIGIRNWDELD
jgi:hypothetical protein